MCDRVIILDKGKIIASGTNDELKELANIKEKISIEVKGLDSRYLNEIKNVPSVNEVNYENDILKISYKSEHNNLENIIAFLKNNNIKYRKIYSERPTLNDIFLELTGKELRD